MDFYFFYALLSRDKDFVSGYLDITKLNSRDNKFIILLSRYNKDCFLVITTYLVILKKRLFSSDNELIIYLFITMNESVS